MDRLTCDHTGSTGQEGDVVYGTDAVRDLLRRRQAS
jgi:hypothetical protein